MADRPSSTVAQPAPRRWGRRLLAAVLLLVLGSAALWAWAAWQLYRSGNEADAAAAEADRLDPGWRMEDLEAKRDQPPDEENGALKLLAVKGRFPSNRSSSPHDKLFDDLPPEARLTEPQIQALRELLEGAGPAVTEARGLVKYPAAATRSSGRRTRSTPS
jgi:hypothetical protein